MSEDKQDTYEVLSPLRCDGKLHMPARGEDETGGLVRLDPEEAAVLIGRGIVQGPIKDPASGKAPGGKKGGGSKGSGSKGSAAKGAGGRSRTKNDPAPEAAPGGDGANGGQGDTT